MSSQYARRTVGVTRGMLLAVLATLALACTSTSATSGPPAPSPSTGLGTSSSPVPSAAPSAQGSASAASAVPTAAGSPSGQPQLLANLCDMLDTATIDSITGLQVPAGQKLNGTTGTGLAATGHCIWGKPSSGIGVEISAFKEAPIQAFLAASLSGMQAVPGVGVSAQGSVATISGTNHASLYVDFGTFGMLVVTSSSNATLDMSASLAKALK